LSTGPRTNKKSGVARPFSPEALLKRSIRAHFTRLGFKKANDGSLVLPGIGKDVVRTLHASQRAERLEHSATFVERVSAKALSHFADGAEIDPSKIQLRLIRVVSGTENSDLFRFASLTWSVPVSVGFGRRLRYLVWDEHHKRLVGLIALGDPVFNLSVRDNLIGWDSHDRSKRLVSLLDGTVSRLEQITSQLSREGYGDGKAQLSSFGLRVTLRGILKAAGRANQAPANSSDPDAS
jgi:hypothetical protein